MELGEILRSAFLISKLFDGRSSRIKSSEILLTSN